MIRTLLVWGILFLTFSSLRAQSPEQGEGLASQQFKQRLRGQFLHNDTAQAIITLYSRRQAGGVGWMTAAVLSAVRLSIGTTSSNSLGGYGTPQSSSGNVGAAFLVAAPLIGYGAGKLAHYSNAHLNRVLTAYAAGQPLPRALRRKLKPRFFQQPIIEYKEVKYKPAR